MQTEHLLSPAGRPTPGSARMVELRRHCERLVERSILTLAAVPDPDARYRRWWVSSMPEPVRRAVEAYNIEEAPRVRRFVPSRADHDRYLEVLGWLNWLAAGNDGPRELKIVWLRAFGVPYWKIAQRFGRSDRTIQRWHEAAISRLFRRYWIDVDRLATDPLPGAGAGMEAAE
jgi:hypothetical protein